MRTNLFRVAVLVALLMASASACADKPPIGTPDPNAVTKQTVYKGQGTASLLTMMQTVGMDPSIAVHKSSTGQMVGPFITPGAIVSWVYNSNSTEPSGTDYPPHPSTTPPANYKPNSSTGGVSSDSVSDPAPGEIETTSFQSGKTVYVFIFEYEFNFQTGQWGWVQVGYTEIQVNTSQK